MNFGNGGSSNAFGCDSSMWFLPSLFVVPLVRIVVGIAVFIFWLMMLIDAIKHSPEKMKIVWVLVIIFTHVVGALIYYFVEKRPKHTAKVHAEK